MKWVTTTKTTTQMKYQAKCTKCANNSHFSTIIFKIAEKQLQTVTEAELLKEREKMSRTRNGIT